MMCALRKHGPILAVVAALFGCGGGDPADDDEAEGTGATGSGASGPSDPGSGAGSTGGPGARVGGSANPVGETITLEIEPFDVQPGTERQVCKTVNLPVDAPFEVVRFHSTMEGTSHHFNAYKLLGASAADPVSESEATVHDCLPAAEQVSGSAAYIYGASVAEEARDTPAGVAFRFEPGQRIILEQHVINPTPDVAQGGVTFELQGAASDAVIEHHADVMWFGNWTFTVLANQETSATKHCQVPYDVEVFGLKSHFHKLGTHFSIEKWTPGSAEHLYDSTDWAHPVYLDLAPEVPLAAGEGLEWTCTWKNPTSVPVFPGINSTDEMCITFAFAYPKSTLSGDPIQCN